MLHATAKSEILRIEGSQGSHRWLSVRSPATACPPGFHQIGIGSTFLIVAGLFGDRAVTGELSDALGFQNGHPGPLSLVAEGEIDLPRYQPRRTPQRRLRKRAGPAKSEALRSRVKGEICDFSSPCLFQGVVLAALANQEWAPAMIGRLNFQP